MDERRKRDAINGILFVLAIIIFVGCIIISAEKHSLLIDLSYETEYYYQGQEIKDIALGFVGIYVSVGILIIMAVATFVFAYIKDNDRHICNKVFDSFKIVNLIIILAFVFAFICVLVTTNSYNRVSSEGVVAEVLFKSTVATVLNFAAFGVLALVFIKRNKGRNIQKCENTDNMLDETSQNTVADKNNANVSRRAKGNSISESEKLLMQNIEELKQEIKLKELRKEIDSLKKQLLDEN